MQYWWEGTTLTIVLPNAQFNRHISTLYNPLVHAGNQNVIVPTELAKKNVVAASRKASNAQARAVATVVVRRIPTTVNEYILLRVT